MADGQSASNMYHRHSAILIALAAYGCTFTQLWPNCVLVHNNLIWTSPSPAHLFHQAPITTYANTPCQTSLPHAPVPSSRSNSHGAVDKRQRSNCPGADFTASAGIFDLATPVPGDQRLLKYIFDAMPPHTSFPKLTDPSQRFASPQQPVPYSQLYLQQTQAAPRRFPPTPHRPSQ
jgi:hypothetical protein